MASIIEKLGTKDFPRLRLGIGRPPGRMDPAAYVLQSFSHLCQSVCREVLDHAAGFEYRGEGEFRGWLYARALGKIRDRQRYWFAAKRDAGREEALPRSASGADLAASLPSFETPSRVAIREEDMRRLEQAFERLPPEYREAITLAYVVGLSRREIAAEMRRSEAAARVLLYRARARIGFLVSEPRVIGCDPMQEGTVQD